VRLSGLGVHEGDIVVMRRQRYALLVAVLACCFGIVRSASFGDAGSREGCMKQWLFNGVWRVKVTDVEPHMNGNQQDGWQVTEVWRNGTSGELAPNDTAFKDQTLELGNGTAVKSTDSTGGSLSQQQVNFNEMAPSGQLTYQQLFLMANVDPSNKPKGLLLVFNGNQLAQWKSRPQFTTSKYNFHFNLGCVASGAAANAEGGSNQVMATEGCLNQWMSNGVWKMRVTAITPNPPDATPQNQNGWLVTQTWENASGRGVIPGGGADQGTKFVGTRVSDEFLATESGNNVSSFNAVGGFHLGAKPGSDWAPGSSWTFQQLFVGGGLVGTDKPVRLLVTFDAKTQNALPAVPHYRMPANFRIDLTCSK